MVLRPALKRPILVVDWHNTLQVRDQIPAANMTNFADVHILSYVATWTREGVVKKDSAAMIPLHIQNRLMGSHTCWEKVGEGGKMHCVSGWVLMPSWMMTMISSRNAKGAWIAMQSVGQKAITTTCHHNLPAHMVWKSFAEAVEVFLEDWDF